MLAERRGPAVQQCLRAHGRQGRPDNGVHQSAGPERRLYDEAKAEKTKRFWGLYVHVAKLDTLRAAYEIAKKHNGAPGIDGVTFAAIEASGVEGWLAQLRDELVTRTYRPLRNGASRYPSAGARSACWGSRRFGTGWCRGRSNSSWSRSSKRTSATGRTAIGPSGRRTRRWPGWLRALCLARRG